MRQPATERVRLAVVAREWARIGCIGFGGPPAHIALLRELCVERRRWLSAREFEDGVAATNLLPGPASTQLAIYCAWRLRGRLGAVVGGFCFILPGLIVILGLAVLLLGPHPPRWVEGAAAGAGAAVPAIAVAAAIALIPASWRRTGAARDRRVRWTAYLVLGLAAAATIGPWLVLVLAGCGIVEVAAGARGERTTSRLSGFSPALIVHASSVGGLGALVWVAFKVGALSYGGGFVIIPLMQQDAVNTYHWMTGGQFLSAVALGQITPGPVVHTVAVVGYAAAGIGGGLLASLVAFGPSFAFVLIGAPHFERLRANTGVQHFLTGAGAASIGAIAGSAIGLGLELEHLWQVGVLALATAWLLGLHRGVVSALLIAAALGVVAAWTGAPIGG
jgi:chromate transporter